MRSLIVLVVACCILVGCNSYDSEIVVEKSNSSSNMTLSEAMDITGLKTVSSIPSYPDCDTFYSVIDKSFVYGEKSYNYKAILGSTCNWDNRVIAYTLLDSNGQKASKEVEFGAILARQIPYPVYCGWYPTKVYSGDIEFDRTAKASNMNMEGFEVWKVEPVSGSSYFKIVESKLGTKVVTVYPFDE